MKTTRDLMSKITKGSCTFIPVATEVIVLRKANEHEPSGHIVIRGQGFFCHNNGNKPARPDSITLLVPADAVEQ